MNLLSDYYTFFQLLHDEPSDGGAGGQGGDPDPDGGGDPKGGDPEPKDGKKSGGDPTKVFQAGYAKGIDTGKDRAREDLLNKINEGRDNPFNSFDEVVSLVQSDPITDVTKSEPYQKLQDTVKKQKETIQSLQGKVSNMELNGDLRSAANEAIDELTKEDNKLTLRREHLMRLFQDEYNLDRTEGGQLVAKKGNAPDFDEMGNQKPLKQSIIDFVTESGYVTSTVKGLGGESGGGGGTQKPKRSEFQKAVQENNGSKAEGLWEQAQKAGGFEEDVNVQQQYGL